MHNLDRNMQSKNPIIPSPLHIFGAATLRIQARVRKRPEEEEEEEVEGVCLGCIDCQ